MLARRKLSMEAKQSRTGQALRQYNAAPDVSKLMSIEAYLSGNWLAIYSWPAIITLTGIRPSKSDISRI